MKDLKMKPYFVTDSKGKKLSVLLTIGDYKKILEKLEELDDIKLYDEVKARREEKIPLEDYLKNRRKRNGKV